MLNNFKQSQKFLNLFLIVFAFLIRNIYGQDFVEKIHQDISLYKFQSTGDPELQVGKGKSFSLSGLQDGQSAHIYVTSSMKTPTSSGGGTPAASLQQTINIKFSTYKPTSWGQFLSDQVLELEIVSRDGDFLYDVVSEVTACKLDTIQGDSFLVVASVRGQNSTKHGLISYFVKLDGYQWIIKNISYLNSSYIESQGGHRDNTQPTCEKIPANDDAFYHVIVAYTSQGDTIKPTYQQSRDQELSQNYQYEDGVYFRRVKYQQQNGLIEGMEPGLDFMPIQVNLNTVKKDHVSGNQYNPNIVIESDILFYITWIGDVAPIPLLQQSTPDVNQLFLNKYEYDYQSGTIASFETINLFQNNSTQTCTSHRSVLLSNQNLLTVIEEPVYNDSQKLQGYLIKYDIYNVQMSEFCGQIPDQKGIYKIIQPQHYRPYWSHLTLSYDNSGGYTPYKAYITVSEFKENAENYAPTYFYEIENQCDQLFYEKKYNFKSVKVVSQTHLSISSGNQIMGNLLYFESSTKISLLGFKVSQTETCQINYCQICFSNLDQCNVCMGSNLIQRSNRHQGECNCIDGLFQDDNISPVDCQQCNSKCSTCSGTADYCVSCKALNNFQLPSCDCAAEHYLATIGGEQDCVQCLNICISCDNGQSCLKCRDTNALGELCIECIESYFYSEQQKKCLECPTGCKKCSGSSSCSECVESNRRLEDCLSCDDYYFMEVIQTYEQCSKCIPNCIECEDKITCKACDGQGRNSTQNCECTEIGQYAKEGEQDCQQCSVLCETCLKYEDSCTTCNNTGETDESAFRVPQKQCSCPDGHYETLYEKTCTSCGKFCSQCELFVEDGAEEESIECSKCYDSNADPTENCRNCLSGFFAQYEQLETESSDKEANSLDFSCIKCTKYDQNCTGCDQDQCLACEKDFELDSTNKCVKTSIIDKNISQEVILCDPTTPEMYNSHCLTCQYSDKTCLSCSTQQYRILKNGKCVCDVMYMEDDQGRPFCVPDPQNAIMQEEQMKTVVQTAGTTAGTAAATGLLFVHPALLLQLLDTLQQIGYILYLQIDYPFLVQEYFKLFEMFDFEFFPNIVAFNKYHMDSPEGFSDQGVDSLLYRNSSQYIVLSLICIGIYFCFKILQFYLVPKNQIRTNTLQKILNFVVQQFEYQILLGGTAACYLNFTVFCYLQLGSTKVKNLTQICSVTFAYFALFAFSVFPFIVVQLSKNIVALKQNEKKLNAEKMILKEKEKTNSGSKLQKAIARNKINSSQNQENIDTQLNKYGVLFEEFKTENIWQAAYFGIIGFRKIFFAFNLVALNNFPALNLVFFLAMNTFTTAYIVLKKPHSSNIHQTRDIITELCFFVIFAASFPLIGEPTDEQKITISKVIISAITIILAVELLSLFINYIQTIIQLIKKIADWAKDDARKQKQLKKELHERQGETFLNNNNNDSSFKNNSSHIDSSQQQNLNNNNGNVELSNVSANFEQFCSEDPNNQSKVDLIR